MHADIEKLFINNENWAQSIRAENPDFFATLAKQQTPDFLWLGCSDSRVPANQLMGLSPGEVFVHRNIANQVISNDPNCLSVIQYAVDALAVKHIIVCGHYGCGGVKASMGDKLEDPINSWLNNLRDIYQSNTAALNGLNDDDKFKKLCELNVIEQVNNVCQTNTVNNAWQRDQHLTVHGFIYDLEDGILHDLKVSTSGK